LPVISVAALVKMTKLTEESDVDNVLLEWLIMVELQAKGKRVLPILLGRMQDDVSGAASDKKHNKVMSNLFDTRLIEALPDIAHSKTCKEAEDILLMKALPDITPSKTCKEAARILRLNKIEPSPALMTTSVKAAIEKLTDMLGVLAWDLKSSHGGGASQPHRVEGFKKSLLADCSKKALKILCDESRDMHDAQEETSGAPEGNDCRVTARDDALGEGGNEKRRHAEESAAHARREAELALREKELAVRQKSFSGIIPPLLQALAFSFECDYKALDEDRACTCAS